VVVSSTTPEQFLLSAYPNPFNPSTNVSLTLPVQSYVEVRVFDVTGRKVRNLLQKDLASGMQTFAWDGLDDGGTRVASGFYILQTAVYPSDGSAAYSASTRLLLSK
jgi:flagellar hook assembly protein FlgD